MTAPDEKLVIDVIVRDKDGIRTFDKVGDAAVKAGRDFDKASDGAGKLQAQIDQTTITLRELGREFDKTGDRALLKDIGKERRTLAGLTKLRKEMAGLADAAGDVGKASFKGFFDAIGALPSQLKGAAIVGLTGAAAAAAPAVGAIIGGAIVTGIGAAGIGTGVALAFQDPRVGTAASDLGMRVKTAFVDASAGMVQPTIDALGVLGDAGADVAREMGGMWDSLAPEVVPLAEAIGDMAREAMPGLRDAVEAAKPALRVLAKELPEIGDAFSDMFSTIAGESDGAILGLVALLDGLEGTIRITGDAIAWLSSVFEDMVRSGTETTGNLEDLIGWFPVLGDKMREANDRGERWLATLEGSKKPSEDAARASREVGNAVKEAGEEAEKAARHFEDMFGVWMGVDESAIAVRDAIRDVKESLDENGRAFGDNSEAADENAQAFLRAVGAAEQHRQKMIQSGQSVPYANKVFQETVDKLYAQGIAAGITRGQLDALLGKYRDLATAPNIVKTVTFVQQGQVPGGAKGVLYAQAKGGIVAAAQGMVTKSPTVLFGERGTGQEVYVPQLGISRQRGLALSAVAAGMHGASVVPNERMGGMSAGDTYVYVTIDGQQLQGRIDRVVRDRDRGLKRRAMAGSGRR